MFRERIRLRFSKRGGIRYISHLDLIRTFERAIRRSGLPIRMTGGFNPRPRLSFPLSLAVGIEGEEEVVELELAEWVAPAEAAEGLQKQLPDGLDIIATKLLPDGRKGRVVEVVYEVGTAPGHGLFGDIPIEQRIASVMTRRSLIVKRPSRTVGRRAGRGSGTRGRVRDAADAGSKSVDIRPYVRDIRPVGDALLIHLEVTPQGSARPQEVLAALGLPLDRRACRYRITRKKVILAASM